MSALSRTLVFLFATILMVAAIVVATIPVVVSTMMAASAISKLQHDRWAAAVAPALAMPPVAMTVQAVMHLLHPRG